MSRKVDFIKQKNDGYLSKGESIILGSALLDGDVLGDAQIKIPLKNPKPSWIDCRSNRNWKN